MQNDRDSISLLHQVRLVLARAGDRDSMAWWESEALSQGGAFVLGRLFPRTRLRAAARLAIEAARVHHAERCPSGTINLFDLGPDLERSVALVEPSIPADLADPIRSRDELSARFAKIGVVSEPPMNGLTEGQDRVVSLGNVSRQATTAVEELRDLIARLVPPYLLGEPRQPVLPYVVVQ